MATSPWKSLANELPVDGSTVWIRILNYYGPPFAAVWDLATQQFTTVTTGLLVPAYYIARWRNP